MDNDAFDRALVSAALALAGEQGWDRVTVAAAARRADLPLDRARGRFPGRVAILARFGLIADQEALSLAPSDGAPRDRLFDVVMRRFDFLQKHRAGVIAVARALPTHPCTQQFIALQSLRSMRWILDAAGIATRGPLGYLRVRGMMLVGIYAFRAWVDDTSEDLSATMAALDRALDRAAQAQASLPSWLCRRDDKESAGAEPTTSEVATGDSTAGLPPDAPPVEDPGL